MATCSRQTWELKQYSRLKAGVNAPIKHPKDSDWDVTVGSPDSPLELAVGVTGHLCIAHGSTMLESYFLVDSKQWLRGFCKNNSLLLVYKADKMNRLFRVRFAAKPSSMPGPTFASTEAESCLRCARVLEKYFPVKYLSMAPEKPIQSQEMIEPRPLISELCSGILGSKNLPLLYQHCNYDVSSSEDDITKFVTTCLLDPNFPAFVGRVEKALNAIKDK